MPQLNNVEFSQDSRGTWGAGLGFHTGQATAVPEFNGSSVAVPVTSTPLAASATYTGETHDRLNLTAGETALSGGIPLANQPGILVSKYKGIVYTDQTGTLYIEESNDGSTWTQTATVSVSADTFTDSGWYYLSKRYYRLRYVNGSTAQTTFVLFDSAGAGQNDTSLTGSNVPLIILPLQELGTLAYTSTNTSTSYNQKFTGVLHRNARFRELLIAHDTNATITQVEVLSTDSTSSPTVPFTMNNPFNNVESVTVGSLSVPANNGLTMNSTTYSALCSPEDGWQIVVTWSVAPTSGSIWLGVIEIQ